MEYVNSLETITDMIATDSRAWCEDYRSAVIYGIVFGLDDDDVIKELMDRFDFTSDYIEEINRKHREWLKLKKILKMTDNLSNVSPEEKKDEPTAPSLN